jgi:hypothetical protein
MENVGEALPGEKRTLGVGTIVLRAFIVLNFIRFALSFLPWFEGTENSAGIADQLFNPRHTSGFRSDFLWLLFSTLYVFFAMFAFVADFRREATARTNVYLGLAWVAAFLIYIYRALLSGVLDFGQRFLW